MATMNPSLNTDPSDDEIDEIKSVSCGTSPRDSHLSNSQKPSSPNRREDLNITIAPLLKEHSPVKK